MSRYKTKNIDDIISFDIKEFGNGSTSKMYFPNDYDFYVDKMGIHHLERMEWNKVMENIGDELVEDMMKVFIKHFRREYWKPHKGSLNWIGDTTYRIGDTTYKKKYKEKV